MKQEHIRGFSFEKLYPEVSTLNDLNAGSYEPRTVSHSVAELRRRVDNKQAKIIGDFPVKTSAAEPDPTWV